MKTNKLLALAAVGIMLLGASRPATAGFIYHASQTVDGRVNFDATFFFDDLLTVDTFVPIAAATQVTVNSFNSFTGLEIDLDSDESLACRRQVGADRCDVFRFATITAGSIFATDLGALANPGLYSRTTGQFVGTLEIIDTNRVPEPGSGLVVAAALAGLGVSLRRRRAPATA